MPLKHPSPDTPRLNYSTYDVARILGISPPTARKLILSGQFPNYHQVPNSKELRVPAPDVLDYCTTNGVPIPKSLLESVNLYYVTYPPSEAS